MRRLFITAHRWTGLTVGLYIALLALSGIGMVFSTTFYQWEFGAEKVSVPMQDAPYAAPDLWLARAEARYGKLPGVEGYFGPRATPMRISAPTIIYTPTGRDVHGVVTVNPYTGEPLARFIAEESWSMLPLKLHMSLFVPFPLSNWILIALSLLLAGFGLSGLYLWWPGRGRMRAAMAVPKPRSPVGLRRFHAGIGFWMSPLIFLAAATGLMLTRGDWAEAIVAPLGASAAFDAATAPRVQCPAATVTTAGTALAVARRRYPGHELASQFLPTKAAPVYTMWLRPAATTVPARGDTEVVVDARCGQILFARSNAEMQPGDTVLTYMVELHNGRLLGVFGEALVVMQGLALTMLPLAGITLWAWKRRRRSKKVQEVGDLRIGI